MPTLPHIVRKIELLNKIQSPTDQLSSVRDQLNGITDCVFGSLIGNAFIF